MPFNSILSYLHARRLRAKWRALNKHNSTSLVLAPRGESLFSQIKVGRYTYGPIWAAWSGNPDEKLLIGSYCSIGGDVKFIMGSEHGYKSISTFPFKVKLSGSPFEALTKGSIELQDDVWVGENAIILSGVQVGQGAIIAAGAVVTKSVQPYAIVGGNPAKLIKFRFEKEICERLAEIDLGFIGDNFETRRLSVLYASINSDNLDEILSSLGLPNRLSEK
jgi:acetyltransferase-like isoleucine patch superfamily enzyme